MLKTALDWGRELRWRRRRAAGKALALLPLKVVETLLAVAAVLAMGLLVILGPELLLLAILVAPGMEAWGPPGSTPVEAKAQEEAANSQKEAQEPVVETPQEGAAHPPLRVETGR